MKYQIVDWDLNFENDRSRSRKSCSFVCVPNKQHGMGFSRIMAEKDGAAIYGIWHCIIGACSQQPVRNGWLTFGGEQAGSAWGVDDMALKFRRPASEIARALSFLSSDKVAWIKCHETNDMPDTHHAVTVDSPSSTLKEEKRREGIEEKEEKRAPLHPSPADEVFDAWNKIEGLPKCLTLSGKRHRTLSVRLNDQFFKANWREAMQKIQTSNFLKGENERGWRASFDWFITPDAVAKIMEGKYDNGKGTTPLKPTDRNFGTGQDPTEVGRITAAAIAAAGH